MRYEVGVRPEPHTSDLIPHTFPKIPSSTSLGIPVLADNQGEPYASSAARWPGEIMIERVDINEFVGRVNQLAPLPAVALRVLQLAEDQRASASDLASIIATDQAMTAKLLRLANSAYFAAGREITTVRDAIV